MASSKAAGVMPMAAFLAVFLLISAGNVVAALSYESIVPQEFALGNPYLLTKIFNTLTES